MTLKIIRNVALMYSLGNIQAYGVALYYLQNGCNLNSAIHHIVWWTFIILWIQKLTQAYQTTLKSKNNVTHISANRCRFKSEQLPGHRFGPWPADILAEDKAAKSWCRPPTTICFSRRQYSRQCGQFRLLGKSAVLGWPLPARYQQTHRPGLISYVCSAQHLEGPISDH